MSTMCHDRLQKTVLFGGLSDVGVAFSGDRKHGDALEIFSTCAACCFCGHTGRKLVENQNKHVQPMFFKPSLETQKQNSSHRVSHICNETALCVTNTVFALLHLLHVSGILCFVPTYFPP